MAAAVTQPLPSADPRTIEAYARELVAKQGHSRVLALAADPAYAGSGSVPVGDVEVAVRGCVSSLAVREVLAELPPDAYVILLTHRPADDLGDSLVARFRRQRIEPLDPWATVPSLFRASHLDAGLRHAMPWLPLVLVEHLPAHGYPASATGVVTRDDALGALAGEVLGISADQIGLGALIERLGEMGMRAAWSGLPDRAREAMVQWVSDRAGPAAGAALTLAAARSTAHVHIGALGLMLDALYGSRALLPEVDSARQVWERGHGLPRVAPAAAAQIGTAARSRLRLLGDTDPAARHPVWRDTPDAFDLAGFPAGLRLSDSHPEGYRARLETFAEALSGAVSRSASGNLEAALGALAAHDLAWADDAEETSRAEMAVRLARWLHAGGDPAVPVESLAAALRRQAGEDGWVDRAVADVWSGSTNQHVAAAYRDLCAQVLSVRQEHDRDFAGLLAEATSHNVLDPGLLPVERVLAETVLPLAGVAPVLLLVIDGMSTGVAVAVAEGISRLAWAEHVPATGPGSRASVLAALPTMTRYSRTSLLCGGLREGTQVEEKREFAALTGGPLFHKDDLRAPAGSAVNPVVAEAIASDDRIVGAVLNTVDDTLAKHDPDGTRWSVSTIQHVEPLLELARQQGRTVVMISDHGHVVERGGRADFRELADTRWRPATTGPAGEGEVALAGPRVLAAGGSIVAAWEEGLRYGRKTAGYHGGASAAEVTIPLLVFAGPEADLAPAGWVPAGRLAPRWWDAAAQTTTPDRSAEPAARPSAPRSRRSGSTPTGGDTLFDVAPVGETGADGPDAPGTTSRARGGAGAHGDPRAAEIGDFMASLTYQRMRAAAGRAAFPDAAVAGVLRLLLAGDGRAPVEHVARELGVAPARVQGAMSGLRRLLNVEAYQVISMDADRRTVLLDVALWRQQFGVGR